MTPFDFSFLQMLMAAAVTYAAIATAVVWGVTEVIKKTFLTTPELADKWAPWIAAGLAFGLGMVAWVAEGKYNIAGIAVYLVGSGIVLYTSKGVHAQVKTVTDKIEASNEAPAED